MCYHETLVLWYLVWYSVIRGNLWYCEDLIYKVGYKLQASFTNAFIGVFCCCCQTSSLQMTEIGQLYLGQSLASATDNSGLGMCKALTFSQGNLIAANGHLELCARSTVNLLLWPPLCLFWSSFCLFDNKVYAPPPPPPLQNTQIFSLYVIYRVSYLPSLTQWYCYCREYHIDYD